MTKPPYRKNEPDLFDAALKAKPKGRPRGKPSWAKDRDKTALKVIANARKKGIFA